MPKRIYAFDPSQEPRLVPPPEPMPDTPMLITTLVDRALAKGASLGYGVTWAGEIAAEIRSFTTWCAESGLTELPDDRLVEVARSFEKRPTVHQVAPSPTTEERRRRAVRQVLRAGVPELFVPDPFEHRYDSVAAGLDLPVGQRVKSFRPEIEPGRWARVRPLFEQILVSALTANPKLDYRRTTTPLAQLLVYSSETGVPLTPAEVLDPVVVDQFMRSRARPGGSDSSYRSTLGAIERALFPRAVRPTINRGRLEPYTPGECEALWRWVTSIPRARAASALREVMVFSLGAGLDMQPLREMRGAHVRREGSYVLVDAPSRGVAFPVLAEWEDEALAAAGAAGDGYVIHPTQKARDGASILNNLSFDATRGARRPPRTPNFDARRMRATWLLVQLQRGTPPAALLAAAGLKSFTSLDRLLPHVEAPAPEDAWRWLRGGR